MLNFSEVVMADLSTLSTRSRVMVGVAGVLVVGALLYSVRSRTAEPGRIPAVPPGDPTVSLPLDGIAVPALSAEEHARIAEGGVVEVKVGEGSIQFKAVKPTKSDAP
jgi:hypothetical protein